MSMLFSMLGVNSDQGRLIQENHALANDLALVVMSNAWPSAEPDEELEQARKRLSELGRLEPALNLEKSWHILHYAFTGDIVPVGSVGDTLMLGEDLGEDMGYGPPRLLSAESTREFAEFLKRLSLDDLQSRLNYSAMMTAGVYGLPMGAGLASEFEGGVRRELASYFPQLKDYVMQMAEKQNGLMMWLS